MKKIKYFLVLVICLVINTKVFANSIDKITMDIYVDNNGDAHIEEIWTTTTNNGTEVYKPYYNLGNSEIKDFKVKMNNTEFTTINNWNVDASFTAKQYKAGINSITNGYELCFGISKYGNNTYTMTYTITNFVSQVTDADMINWTLIPHNLSNKPNYIYIKIYSDFKYSSDLPVWGYGNYGGYAYVYDGYIELVHEDALDSSEYMTVLAKFPKGTFNTNSILSNDFNYYYEMAEEGATAYEEDEYSGLGWIEVVKVLFSFIEFFILVVVTKIVINRANRFGTKNIKFNRGSKNIKKAPYFRDIPCQKNIFRTYWIAVQYKLIKNHTDLLGAILLKWLKEGKVQSVTVTSKILKKEEKALKLVTEEMNTEFEARLYKMMKSASVDGVLENNEFKRWCKSRYRSILKWFSDVLDAETENLAREGLITKKKGRFGTTYIVDEKLKENALQVAGLKNFLNDFSNIKDREAIEVKIWDEYLIYAQIFGIAKKVAKEFKKLYPEVIPEDYYDDIIFIHTISYNGVSAAYTAKSEAARRAQSYSSGGGGFSSGGGGGGSFGGGGGGGGFR